MKGNRTVEPKKKKDKKEQNEETQAKFKFIYLTIRML